MKIRAKLMGLIVSLFILLAAAQLVVQSQVLMPSFRMLERQSAKTNMARVGNAFRRELELLAVSGINWGNWVDTYEFMQDRNPQYAARSLHPAAIRSMKIDMMAFLDVDGRFVWSGAFDPLSGQSIDLDLLSAGELPLNHPWQTALHAGMAIEGLIGTNRGPMLAAMSPVLDGQGRGPHRGAVLIGRLLTDTEIARIARQAQTNLALIDLRTSAVAAALPSGATLDGPDALIEFPTVTDVYRTFDDVYGDPLFRIRSEIPRAISARGRQTAASAFAFLLAACAVVLLVLLAVVNRTILSPLDRITRHAVAIGHDDRPERLNLNREDEFGTLAREFERMMDRLLAARRELIDRSFESGAAEMASGALHNIGNTMTPLAVDVASLQDRLGKAPTADVHLVLAELDRVAGDQSRRTDLVHFLRLTSLELAAIVQAAQREIATIARQTLAVQDALAEQRNFARTGAVEETVSLSELIAHCVEIVPAALRQRLSIERDASLDKIGALRLARTTLRQVLQNLFVNSAEAMGSARQAQGVLRISATIEPGTAREMLHLRIQDEGIGIAAENLARIFVRGYSTKSGDTNSGIGLHWCANALNAIGGSIRAESDGHGQGACLHVVLPVDRPDATLITRVA